MIQMCPNLQEIGLFGESYVRPPRHPTISGICLSDALDSMEAGQP